MRRGDVRRLSPPQSRVRYRDNSPPRRFDRGRVYDDTDRDRDVQSRRLSEFNESLGRNESTSMKFQWNQLLGKSKNGNPSLDHPNGGYDFNRGGTSRNYRDLQYSDANQKNYGDDLYPYKSAKDGRYSEKDQKNYDGVRYSDMMQKGYEGSRYSDMSVRSYEDARYSDKDWKKSYEGTRYSDINLKSYEDARYSDKGQKNYDGVRYSDMKQKSYEDARYLDKDEKSYEGYRYSDINTKSYEDARYADKNQKTYDGFRYSDISTKSYEDTRYSDINHKSYEDARAKSYSFHSPDVGVSKVLPSLNLKSGFHEDDLYNSSRLQPCSDKVLVDESPVRKYKSPASEYHNNKEERNSLGYSKDYLDYSRVPFTGSNATGKKPLGLLEEDSLGRGKSYSKLYEKRDRDYSYHIPKEDEIVDYKEFHATKPTFGERYSRQDSLRSTSVVDPIVDRLEECSHSEQFYDSGLDIPNYLEVARARKQEREVLGFDITNGEYKTAVYEDHGNVLSGESDDFERDGDYWTHEDSYKNLLMDENNSFLDEMGGASSKTVLKRKREVDNESNMLKFGNKSSRRFGDDSFAAEKRTDEARKLIFSSNKSKSLKNRLGPCPKKSHDPYSSLKVNKSLLKNRLGPRVDDSYQDSKQKSKSLLKKRLGPHPNKFRSSLENEKSVLKKRLGPRPNKFGSSLENEKSVLKKRLGPKPENNNKATLPWLNPERLNKHKKLTRKNKNQIDDAGKQIQIDDIEEKRDQLEGNLTNEKAEPREDSEEFKLMVEHAFLRYVKQLNENSEQRRRFTEQGENAKLKCSVCGSDPKEYINAESLAAHAFKSSKVGFRSRHLGYHKAICTLMGWKSEVGSQSPWVRENLSDDEALLLKEDLIIWPPVVIVRKRSLENDCSDEHMKVSVEVLESILKEKGYAEKTKICVGQPANQSILLVKFNATFSGLQEALRLHTFYADSKHGESDVQHFDLTGQPLEKLPESMLESIPGSVPSPSPLPPLKCKIEDMPESVPASMTESVQVSMTESVQVSMPESVPGSMTKSVQGSMTESAQMSMTESAQMSMMESAPGAKTELVQVPMTDLVPGSMPESVPVSKTELVQGSMTELVSESIPELVPGSVQGSMMESLTGSLPESVLESVPGSMPESVPGSMTSSSSPPPPPPLERKIEDILYGHLGLAEDLDKLDPETKKRCLVKSKKEIQSIADASLKKEP